MFIGEIFISPCILHKPEQITLFFQVNTSSKLLVKTN